MKARDTDLWRGGPRSPQEQAFLVGRGVAKLRYHLAVQLLLILVYLVVVERVVEIVWGFRAH